MTEHSTDAEPNEEERPRIPPQDLDAVAYLERMMAVGGTLDTISCGFPSIDLLLGGGFRRGDLIVLGGDVGSGKSALALAVALRAAGGTGSVACFSGEFSHQRLLERALAIEGRARVDELRHARLDDGTYASVAAAALRLRESAPLLGHLPPNGVAGLSDLLIEHLGLELLVVDPLQSLSTGRRPLAEDLARAVAELKELALQRAFAVLLVSHLEGSVRDRDDSRPNLDDFGALGAVRQHADVVLGIFREEMYGPSNDVDGAAEIHVLKSRNAALGYADLYFYKQWLRFEDLVEPNR